MTGAAELFMAARTQGNQVGVSIRTLDCEIARGGLPGSPSCCTIEKQQIVIADRINDAGKTAVENTDPNGVTDYGRGRLRSEPALQVANMAMKRISTLLIALALLARVASAQQPVTILDNLSNHFTTNSSTYTSKHAPDVNLRGVLDSPFSTPGCIDIKGADGNVFVRQTTGANLNVNVDGAPTTPVQAAGYGSSPLTVQVSITASATALASTSTHEVCVLR